MANLVKIPIIFKFLRIDKISKSFLKSFLLIFFYSDLNNSHKSYFLNCSDRFKRTSSINDAKSYALFPINAS